MPATYIRMESRYGAIPIALPKEVEQRVGESRNTE